MIVQGNEVLLTVVHFNNLTKITLLCLKVTDKHRAASRRIWVITRSLPTHLGRTHNKFQTKQSKDWKVRSHIDGMLVQSVGCVCNIQTKPSGTSRTNRQSITRPLSHRCIAPVLRPRTRLPLFVANVSRSSYTSARCSTFRTVYEVYPPQRPHPLPLQENIRKSRLGCP